MRRGNFAPLELTAVNTANSRIINAKENNMTATRLVLSYPWLRKDRKSAVDNGDAQYGDYINGNEFNDEVSKIAFEELRETKLVRMDALDQLRQWIAKNPDVACVRTDEVFLLRFLRVKKYSVPMAQQMILKYLNLKETFSTMCKNLDCLEDNVRQLIDNGYIYVSPIRDGSGRRVIMYNVAKFDCNKFTPDDMARVHLVTYETLLETEENHVRGFTHVGDVGGLSGSLITSWSPLIFARLIKWGEQSVPMRHKKIHILNVPTAVKYVYDFASSFISQKINDRITIHPNVKSLHDSIDEACLPLELGGKIPMKEMVDTWKEELIAKRSDLIDLDKMKILSDRGIISTRGKKVEQKSSIIDDMANLNGSFRRLELD